MIARLLQLIAFLVITVAAVWTLWCYQSGLLLPWGLGLALLIFGHSPVLAVELILMNRANRYAQLDVAPLTDLLRAWFAESWCALRAFLWRQPFRADALPDSLANAGGRRGLLLVHGFMCNRGVWNGWYPRLAEAGIPYVGLSLEPPFGGIDEYTKQIAQGVERLRTLTGLPPVVVAHSMGGLAVRAWARNRVSSTLEQIHGLVTLGSPHGGTALVKFNISRNVRQMAVGSDWLNTLAKEEPSGWCSHHINVFSRCDNVVFPARTACLPGATEVEITGCAHLQMVDHPTSYLVVRQLLQEAPECLSRTDSASYRSHAGC